MMKKIFLLLVILSVFVSCKDLAVSKPDNLIPEGKMIDVLYDVALVEAIKVENPNSLKEKGINPETYIYQKYKIDSLQFAKSDQYYASDVVKYEKMYEKVVKRLEKEKAKTDSLIAKGINVGKPASDKKQGTENNLKELDVKSISVDKFRRGMHFRENAR